MSAHVFMTERVHIYIYICMHAGIGDKREIDRVLKSRCRCASVQESPRECVHFYEMKVGRDDGMECGWEGREEEERSSPVALGASAAGIVLCPVGAI